MVVVPVFGESYRARRQCKDRRKGYRTNLHHFLLINAGKGIRFIERQQMTTMRVPSLQSLKHSLDLHGSTNRTVSETSPADAVNKPLLNPASLVLP
jgi:hypothetical protein